MAEQLRVVGTSISREGAVRLTARSARTKPISDTQVSDSAEVMIGLPTVVSRYMPCGINSLLGAFPLPTGQDARLSHI
jgi:hypothetical protein